MAGAAAAGSSEQICRPVAHMHQPFVVLVLPGGTDSQYRKEILWSNGLEGFLARRSDLMPIPRLSLGGRYVLAGLTILLSVGWSVPSSAFETHRNRRKGFHLRWNAMHERHSDSKAQGQVGIFAAAVISSPGDSFPQFQPPSACADRWQPHPALRSETNASRVSPGVPGQYPFAV